MKYKEVKKNESHRCIASCSSFICFVILSSMITVSLGILYVEIFELQDDVLSTDIDGEHVEAMQFDNMVLKDSVKEDVDLGINLKVNTEKLTEDESKSSTDETFKNDDSDLDDKHLKSNNINNEKHTDTINYNHKNIVKVKDNINPPNDDVSIKLKNDGSPMQISINSTGDEVVISANQSVKKKLNNQEETVQAKKETIQNNSTQIPERNSKLSDIESQIVVKESKDEIFKLYMEVEELTDEILSEDPNNEMIKQLAPHLETTLKDIELDRISGIKEGLLHIKTILKDLKNRIVINKTSDKEELLPQNPTIDKKQDDFGKKPVVEIIPDPIYITPLEKEVKSNRDEKPPKMESSKKDQSKEKILTEMDLILKLLDDLKIESEKNPVEGIKKIDEALLKKPNNVDLLLLKARVLDLLSDKEKSNSILEQAISTYHSIIDLAAKDSSLVAKDTLKSAGLACAERTIFRGFNKKAIKILQQMIKFFPEDIIFKNKLGVAFLTFNDIDSAKQIFEESLNLKPNDGFAQVHYGFILKSEGTHLKEAVKYLHSGIQSGAEGTTDGRFYFQLGDSLQRLNQTKRARQVYEEGVQKGLFLNPWQRSLYNVNHLTSRPVWTLDETTYAQFFKKLENNWRKIKLEALAALSLRNELGYKPETENLKDTGDWRQFELFARGKKDPVNCAVAPITCGLIEEFLPAASCKRGQVKFSIMQPSTHVWPHTGPTNCRLRAHLGLVIPDGVEMRVANKTMTWQEGKVLIFDDSWEHEVWHKGYSPRLILIVDVWHPQLSESERRSLSAI